MKCNAKWLYWFLGITIFCIDRITKNAALAEFSERVTSAIPCLSYEMVINRGISWGAFHSLNDMLFMFISLLIAGITALVAWWAYANYKQDEFIFGQVCIIAGSLSNIVDRIIYHGVIDFILISYRDHSWPVFNIADMAIVVGVGIVCWQQYRIKK